MARECPLRSTVDICQMSCQHRIVVAAARTEAATAEHPAVLARELAVETAPAIAVILEYWDVFSVPADWRAGQKVAFVEVAGLTLNICTGGARNATFQHW